MDVKSLDKIKSNYSGAVSEAQRRYKDAVSTKTGVIAAAIAGQANYEAQMTNSTVLKRRVAGLNKVSDGDWQKAASTTGGDRIGPGMRAKVDKQASGFAPYKSALEGTSLPARTIDPMANLDRVRATVAALVAEKKRQMGE